MNRERSSREGILLNLLEEFRGTGFDGASLSRISDLTGLGKASLYHHFPGGKGEMAEAVMDLAGAWVQANVLDHLRAADAPKARLERALASLEGFYQGGAKSCLLEVMPIGGGPQVKAKVAEVLHSLVDAFRDLALAAGFSQTEAQRRAEGVLVTIQGSLVVARGLGDPGVFLRQIQGLREGFLRP